MFISIPVDSGFARGEDFNFVDFGREEMRTYCLQSTNIFQDVD